MVESESFIKEVSEEVRKDKLFKGLRKYRLYLASVILILIGGVGGYEYYIFNKKLRSERNGEFLVDTIESLKTSGQTLSEKFENSFVSMIIDLNEAKYFEEKGDKGAALDRYNRIITEYGNDKFIRDYAKFQIYLMDPAESLIDTQKVVVLDELSAPGSPLKLLALEQKLYIYVKMNDLKNIKLQTNLILSDPAITPEQVNRIKEIENLYGQN
jgi:hypothetical protein